MWLNVGLGLLGVTLAATAVAQGRQGARLRHALENTPASIDAHIARPRPLAPGGGEDGSHIVRSYLADMWSDSPELLWVVQDVAQRRREPEAAAAGDAEDLMHDIVGGTVDVLIVSGSVVHVEPVDRSEAMGTPNLPFRGEDGLARHYYAHETDRRRRPFYASGVLLLCCRRRPAPEPVRVFPVAVALDEGVPHMSAATATGEDADDVRRWRTPRRYHVLAYSQSQQA